MNIDTLQSGIQELAAQSPTSFSDAQLELIQTTLNALDRGEIRVASLQGEAWVTHDWVKQAILFYFKSQKMSVLRAGDLSFYDKIPLKQWDGSEGVRVVPSAVVRRGAYISPKAVLMPSYVNIGAYVGEGTMVDTWATVGSCAQIGARVHLSGGVGIGGVLEPIQAQPVIVEDDVFVGSRCIVVEGVRVRKRAVLGAGVVLTQSTPIIDVTGPEPVTHKGVVPENAVVIPGSRVKSFPAGEYSVPAALIIGQRSARTDEKTSLTDALRDFDVPLA